MHSIFDVPWENVGLEHLRRFLADAGEEGVTWEAKADGDTPDRRLRSHSVRNGVCGLANQIGGFFIIGARQRGRAWELPGIQAPSPEPRLWLDQVLRQLRPVPRYEHKAFDLGDGRMVAVIRVEPLSQTPCMTRDGQVFERVSSETTRVTDPVRLRELFTRGERARQVAEQDAAQAAADVLQHPDAHFGRSVWASVGVAASSYEPDISSRLFHSSFVRKTSDDITAELQSMFPVARMKLWPSISQQFVHVTATSDHFDWLVRAHWSGRASVMAAVTADVVNRYPLIDGFIVPSWHFASRLVTRMGGYGGGRLHLTVRVQTTYQANQPPDAMGGPAPAPPPGTLWGKLPPTTEIQRPIELGSPTEDLIGSIQRDLNRAAGNWMFEGVPDPPG